MFCGKPSLRFVLHARAEPRVGIVRTKRREKGRKEKNKKRDEKKRSPRNALCVCVCASVFLPRCVDRERL